MWTSYPVWKMYEVRHTFKKIKPISMYVFSSSSDNEHFKLPKFLDVHLSNASQTLKLHPTWLRDHCR